MDDPMGFGMDPAHRLLRVEHIGGSDARIIVSGSREEVDFLFRVKRREVDDESCENVLIAQIGNATETLNAVWFERKTGLSVTDRQKFVIDDAWPVASCTLDGLVREGREGSILGVFEGKFMVPFGWSMREALAKYMPQLQHNMTVTRTGRAWLSVLTGAGHWQAAEVRHNEFYSLALRDAEEEFWWSVKTGKPSALGRIPPLDTARTKIVDMGGDPAWMAVAREFVTTSMAVDRNERAKRRIRNLVPPDAIRASGGGVVAGINKGGTVKVKIDGANTARSG